MERRNHCPGVPRDHVRRAVKAWAPAPIVKVGPPVAVVGTACTPAARAAGTPPSVTAPAPAGRTTRAEAFGGTTTPSESRSAPRRQCTATGPAVVGSDPAAPDSAVAGGATWRTGPAESVPGETMVTPSKASWMATRADEPQPWDMLSPSRSLGTQSSQQNVPPEARMLA